MSVANRNRSLGDILPSVIPALCHPGSLSSRPCAGIHREVSWKQEALSYRAQHRGSRRKAGMTMYVGYGVGGGRYLFRFSARSRAISDDETFFQFFDCPHVCLTKVAPRAVAGLNLAGG